MQTAFITGANRGIGLELVRQLLARGEQVFASCRRPEQASDLHALQKEHPEHLTIIQLDLRDEGQIAAAVAAVKEKSNSLNLLINNAGISPRGDRLGHLSQDSLLATLHTNAVGPALLAQAFAPLLAQASEARIVNISSGMGSISEARGGWYAYRMSKAALNMLSRLLAADLRSQGTIVVALGPGWVQTDMGGRGAPLSAQESVRAMLRTIAQLTLGDSGRYLQRDGSAMDW